MEQSKINVTHFDLEHHNLCKWLGVRTINRRSNYQALPSCFISTPKLMYLVQKILPVACTATGWPAGAPFVSGKNSADYRFRPRYPTNHLTRVSVLRASRHTFCTGVGHRDGGMTRASILDRSKVFSSHAPTPPSRPALGPSNPLIERVPDNFASGLKRPEIRTAHSPDLVPTWGMNGAIPLFPLCAPYVLHREMYSSDQSVRHMLHL